MSEEAKAKTAAFHRGKKLSEEHRKKLSIAHMGQRAWNKGLRGRKLTAEHVANIAAARARKRELKRAENTTRSLFPCH
jgi:hypothetical protein